jgi:hypothetical protein
MTEKSKLPLSKDDFNISHWKDVTDNSNSKICFSYYLTSNLITYRSGFQTKLNSENNEKSKSILRLLYNASSFELTLESDKSKESDESERFKPTICENEKYFTTEMFDDEEFKFFESIVCSISDNELRARIADIILLKNKHNDYQNLAVHSYVLACKVLELYPNNESHIFVRVSRALQISRSKEDRVFVLNYIHELLTKYINQKNKKHALDLMKFLQNKKQNIDKSDTYILFCEEVANEEEANNNYELYFTRQQVWFLKKSETSMLAKNLRLFCVSFQSVPDNL